MPRLGRVPPNPKAKEHKAGGARASFSGYAEARAGKTEWKPRIFRLSSIAQGDAESRAEQQKAPRHEAEGLFV
jgi:hypothetical protein